MRTPCTGLGGGSDGLVYSRRLLAAVIGEAQYSNYLTCLACRSTGAPLKTAAAKVSPGSLPSITLLGIGL